jgi:hypothetical protein
MMTTVRGAEIARIKNFGKIVCGRRSGRAMSPLSGKYIDIQVEEAGGRLRRFHPLSKAMFVLCDPSRSRVCETIDWHAKARFVLCLVSSRGSANNRQLRNFISGSPGKATSRSPRRHFEDQFPKLWDWSLKSETWRKRMLAISKNGILHTLYLPWNLQSRRILE